MVKSRKKTEKEVKKKAEKVAEKKPKDIQTNDLPNEAIESDISHPNTVEVFKEETVVNNHTDKKPKKSDVETTSGDKPTKKKSEKINKVTGKKTKKNGKVTTKQTRKTTEEKVKTSTKNTAEIEDSAEKTNITQTNDQAVDETGSGIVNATDEVHVDKVDSTTTDDQTGSATEEVIEDPDAIVSFTEKEENLQADDQVDSATEEVIEDPDSIVSFIETEENVEAEDQTGSTTEEVIEDSDTIVSYSEKEDDPQTDKPKDDELEDVIGIVNTETLTENESGIQIDEEVETDIEDVVDDIQMDVSYYEPPTRTKKTGIFIPVVLMIAAVVLLLVGAIERRSAKKALVEANTVADVIRQMQEESVKEKEQIIHFQIEGRELVIDALLLTRNGLELELANTDEKEVKKIIGVFINDIDGREKKMKSEITVLRNKLKINN